MKELKILIGGSPCTFWSIAQTKHRETKPSGMGWELFLNYLIAKEKFKPDLFLYENNVSADPSIKEEIKKDLGVDDFALLRGEESGASYVEINSALVSAQSRKRFYVHNCGEDMPMPKDRGILLKDILETGGNMSMDRWYKLKNVCEGEGSQIGNDGFYLLNPSKSDKGKSRTIKASYNNSSFANFLRKSGFGATGVAERIPSYGNEEKARPLCSSYAYKGEGVPSIKDNAFPDNPNKQVFDYVAEKIRERENTEIKINEKGLRLSYTNGHESGTSQGAEVKLPTAKASAITTASHGMVFEPICLNPQSGDFGGSFASKGGQPSVQNRVYSDEGKSTALTTAFNPKIAEPMPKKGKNRPVYEVKSGQIEIKGKKYPIRLKDGKYIIRKLSVTECERLQTMPDGYTKALPASKAYKALGNGWTAEVIIHILGWGLRNVPRDTKIKVLSMYDGIATGRYVLDRLGFKNVEYHAYEIDKDPIKVALDNYPDIMEHGDAFQVRKEDWSI